MNRADLERSVLASHEGSGYFHTSFVYRYAKTKAGCLAFLALFPPVLCHRVRRLRCHAQRDRHVREAAACEPEQSHREEPLPENPTGRSRRPATDVCPSLRLHRLIRSMLLRFLILFHII